MGEDLSILLTAKLNETASKPILDKQIDDLSKKLKELQLNIKIDSDTLKALNDFSKSMEKANILYKQQNEVVKKNILITQELDGANKKVEQSIKKNGEIVETTTVRYKKQKEAIEENIAELKKEATEYGKLASQKDKFVNDEYAGSTNTYRTGKYSKVIANNNSDGMETSRTEIYDKAKEEADIDKVNKKRVKSMQDASDLARKLTYNEERERLNITTSFQDKLEKTIFNSNENISEFQTRINKRDAFNYEQVWQKAFKEKESAMTSSTSGINSEERRSFNLGEQKNISSFTGTSRTDAEKYAKEIYGAKAAVTGFNQVMDKNGKIIAEATVRVNKNSKEYIEYKMKVDQATKSVHQFGDAVGKKTGKDMGVFEQFKVAMERFPVWIASATLFMGTLHQLQNSVKYIVDMNTAMVELNKVVDLSSDKLNSMRDSAISLGKELGHSSVDIMNSMAEFGRVTKNPTEIVELTKVATMASNVTSLTAEEAAKSLNTTMISFKMNAMDSIKVLNQWNEIKCMSPHTEMCA